MSVTQYQTWSFVDDFMEYMMGQYGVTWEAQRLRGNCRRYFDSEFGEAFMELTESLRDLYRDYLTFLYNSYFQKSERFAVTFLSFTHTLFKDYRDVDPEKLLCLFAFTSECGVVFAALGKPVGIDWAAVALARYIINGILTEMRRQGGYRKFVLYVKDYVRDRRQVKYHVELTKHQQDVLLQQAAVQEQLLNLGFNPQGDPQQVIQLLPQYMVISGDQASAIYSFAYMQQQDAANLKREAEKVLNWATLVVNAYIARITAAEARKVCHVHNPEACPYARRRASAEGREASNVDAPQESQAAQQPVIPEAHAEASPKPEAHAEASPKPEAHAEGAEASNESNPQQSEQSSESSETKQRKKAPRLVHESLAAALQQLIIAEDCRNLKTQVQESVDSNRPEPKPLDLTVESFGVGQFLVLGVPPPQAQGSEESEDGAKEQPESDPATEVQTEHSELESVTDKPASEPSERSGVFKDSAAAEHMSGTSDNKLLIHEAAKESPKKKEEGKSRQGKHKRRKSKRS